MRGDEQPVMADYSGVSPEKYRFVMRQVASPVAIVAARKGKNRCGLTATAICSAAADPPTLLVCINRNASAEALIVDSGAFSVNFLAENQAGIARLFSMQKIDNEDRFAEGIWKSAVTGAPLLVGAVCTFDCKVVTTIPCGTHQIFIGRVLAADSVESSPLLYRDGYFRRIVNDAGGT